MLNKLNYLSTENVETNIFSIRDAITNTTLVSASDVTPTDHWLNVWCILHTYQEILQEFRSRRQIG